MDRNQPHSHGSQHSALFLNPLLTLFILICNPYKYWTAMIKAQTPVLQSQQKQNLSDEKNK